MVSPTKTDLLVGVVDDLKDDISALSERGGNQYIPVIVARLQDKFNWLVG